MRPDALELSRWADRLDCRARLPELIRRLVHSTAQGLVEVDFPAGEGIQRRGVDGVVRATSSTAFVPQGLSVWEMSCRQDVATKANGDFDKRKTVPPSGIDPQETTFIFVTPRRWSGREEWAAARRGEGVWHDVRAYDADSLEQWIELSPAAAAWLAEVLGLPSEALGLEVFWSEWSAKTTPATHETLPLAGREPAEKACVDWLEGRPSALGVTVSDPGEAAAFVYAALRKLLPAKRQWRLDRSVVLRDDAVLRQVARQSRGLIIIALECGVEVARSAAERGHHVLLATPSRLQGERLELGPLDRPKVTAVLERMGVDPERARSLSHESRGDTATLRRLLGAAGSSLRVDLAPLVLAGSWDEGKTADMDAVLRITGVSESEFRRLVRLHATGPEAVLRRVGTQWSWHSRRDAWRLLGEALTPGELERYRDVTVQVLSMADPRFELSADQRPLAAVKGKVLPHSAALRRGLAETAALLADEEVPADEGRNTAGNVVFQIFDVVSTWQQWATLDEVLPTLAEADPENFLHAVRKLVEEDGPLVRALRESSSRSALVWSDQLNGLVCALETLAWHRRHLASACDLLAALAEHEAASSRKGDRALRALRDVLLAWLPHTTADLETRIAALRSIQERRPEISFSLLLALLPRVGGDVSHGTHKPAWRPWLDGWSQGVTPAERDAMYSAVWDDVLRLAEADPNRWVALVPHLSVEKHLPRALEILGGLTRKDLGDETQLELWAALRHVLHRHRSAPDADGALPSHALDALQTVYDGLAPGDQQRRLGWLFSRNPQLPNVSGRDWEARESAAAGMRATACKELVDDGGPDAVLRFSRQVEDAFLVGVGVVEGTGETTARELLHASADHDADWARQLRVGLLSTLVRGFEQAVVGRLGLEELPSQVRAEAALGLPFQGSTWDLVERWGEEATEHYWRQARAWLDEDADGEVSRAVRALCAAGRAVDAIELMAMQIHRLRDTTNLEPEDIVMVLEAALTTTPEPGQDTGSLDVHHVGELLDRLAASGAQWEVDVGRLEWLLVRYMDHVRKPAVLFKALAQNPAFFVMVLSLVFPGEDDPPGEPTAEETARVHNAYALLQQWDQIPGLTEDGGVDLDRLAAWVDEARRLARQSRRGVVADHKVGEVLARSPMGTDGVWPHEAVRELLEHLRDTNDVQLGFVMGRCNQRGAFRKAIGEDGAQERSIAASYREDADALRRKWPVVARFLHELARRYERDAKHEDLDSLLDKERFLVGAHTEDRLAVWIDELQADGRYSFTLAEATDELERPAAEVKLAMASLVDRRRLASPEEGYFVVVPLEYREAASPPATWFLDGWMQWAKEPYAVGLLTAASLYGAAHQQPQVFQVLVGRAREDAMVGRNHIEFVVDPQLEHRRTVPIKTDTGSIKVLTPEETALSLVQFSERCGGIDAVGQVLSELGQELDTMKLAEVANGQEDRVLQRLGYLLTAVGWCDRVRPLRELIVERDPAVSRLRSDAEVPEKGLEVHEPWRIVLDGVLELDE